jgi:hypothetical protein
MPPFLPSLSKRQPELLPLTSRLAIRSEKAMRVLTGQLSPNAMPASKAGQTTFDLRIERAGSQMFGDGKRIFTLTPLATRRYGGGTRDRR